MTADQATSIPARKTFRFWVEASVTGRSGKKSTVRRIWTNRTPVSTPLEKHRRTASAFFACVAGVTPDRVVFHEFRELSGIY